MYIPLWILLVLCLLALVGVVSIIALVAGHFLVREDEELERKTDAFKPRLKFELREENPSEAHYRRTAKAWSIPSRSRHDRS